MEVSKEKILDLARQIYMDLEPKEVEKLAVDVEKEASDVRVINEADTDNVKQDVSVLNRSNSLRKDEVEGYKNKGELLQNCRDVEDSMFVIPKIV